jgi:hypothetical protein
MNTKADAKALATLTAIIDQLDDAQLCGLNNLIVNRLKDNHRRKIAAASVQFRVGQKVSFYNTRNYKEMTGTIMKINKKTIRVQTTEDGIWKVTSTMLKAA